MSQASALAVSVGFSRFQWDPIGIGRAEIFGGTGGAGNPICWHRAGVLRIHRIFLGPIYLSHDSKTAYISDHKVA